MPTSRTAPVDVVLIIGPPDSPWQVSTPPWVNPAQSSVAGASSG